MTQSWNRHHRYCFLELMPQCALCGRANPLKSKILSYPSRHILIDSAVWKSLRKGNVAAFLWALKRHSCVPPSTKLPPFVSLLFYVAGTMYAL